VPSEIEEREVHISNVESALVNLSLARSRHEARRLIDQGGVRVDGAKVGSDYELRDGQVLSVGKRKFVRIRVR
jgi:tyrosyl-tRNA synthetase